MPTSYLYKQAMRYPVRVSTAEIVEKVVNTTFANDYKEFVKVLLTQDPFCQDLPKECV